MTPEEKLLDQLQEHFREALDGWGKNREQWSDDLDFLEGDHWPSDVKGDRDKDGRPCLVINKLPSFVDQVVGDQLQNRPQLKVRPVDNKADVPTAEVFAGIIRNIENISDADVAYDTAFEGAVSAGFGTWRILTDYVDDESFDQEILIHRIHNQFTVYPDPLANRIDYSDGRYFFITEELPRKEFDRQFPHADAFDMSEIPESLKEWLTEEKVRVAEYFYLRYFKSKLYEVETGTEAGTVLIDKLPEGHEAVRERSVERKEIWYCKTNGHSFLEKPRPWPGKYFPVIVVFGKERANQGKKSYRGLIRNAKDPQRLYNYNRSLQAETTALAPKAPYLLTPDQVEGHAEQWKQSLKRNFPYLLYNPDPQGNVAAPQRNFPQQMSSAIQQEILISDQEIHDTTGLQLASMGKKSNERSGIAIQERKREGDVGSYGYITALSRALKYQGKVLVDLIPKIYDTPRMQRILGEDGTDMQIPINQAFGPEGQESIYDLKVGKYDVAMTIGPSYTTQRQEAADSMLQFVKAVPDSGPVMMDLIAKNLDWPGAQEMEKRLRKLLPPGIAEPKEGEQPPPQPEPSPQEQMALQEQELKVEQEKVKLQQEQVELAQLQAELSKIEAEVMLLGVKTENEMLAPRKEASKAN
jgi:hypothetical protein